MNSVVNDIPGAKLEMSSASAAEHNPSPPLTQSTRRTWRQKIFSGNGLFFIMCALLLAIGWKLPLARYISPKSGVGYALGIIGGSLMLLLLLYPARKRLRWLSFMGSVKAWFHTHMVMGLIGPICILYHADFSLGATNSNVALFCMLIVSGSGLIGRYFYTRIHYGLSDRVTTLGDLQANAERLRSISLSVPFLPELLQRLGLEEKGLLIKIERCPVLLRPFYSTCLSMLARRRLRRYVRTALHAAARQSDVVAQQEVRLTRSARTYIAERLRATRQVADFKAYTQLFSLWHVLHLPLFFMLLIAGIVHVIAANIY